MLSIDILTMIGGSIGDPTTLVTTSKTIVGAINEISNGLITKIKTTVLGSFHPVGSIYMSTSSTNPGTFMGGTWVAWGTGKVPVGIDTAQAEFNTVEKTGGEKTHTLTVNEMPSHNHTDGTYDRLMKIDGQATASDSVDTNNGTGYETDLYYSGYIISAGGGAAHNNLQPYITCYMWKRTA